MPVRRPLPSPVVVPRSTYYSTSARHDYGIDDSINQAEYFSNAVLDDTYESARQSKNRDNELIRNTRAAIRYPRDPHTADSRTGRSTKRFSSLPPVSASRSPSPLSRGALVPYRAAPPPSSLLSTKINSYLRGSSVPPKHPSSSSGDRLSSISYKSFLVDPPTSPSLASTRSNVAYRSYLSDPSVNSPLSTRSSSKVLRGYIPRAITPAYQSRRPLGSVDDDDYEDEDVDDYHVGSYKRKYKIVTSPQALTYGAGESEANEEEDYEDDAVYSDSGRYTSCPRPSDVSSLKLSSYDGDYDGSYNADMAEMYDYVPFGPSRHGILELTSEPSLTPLSSLTPLPHRALPEPYPSVTITSPYSRSDDSLTKSPFANNNSALDSIVSSAASRAREALANSSLPEYKNASVVLSVEGSAVSEDGQNRYGFRYYPPPIPIKGSGVGLDERILGIAPKPVSPADSFLSKYLDRLRGLRTDIRDHVEKDGGKPSRYLTSSSPSSSSYSSYTPYSSSERGGVRGGSTGVGRVSVGRSSSPYVHQTIDLPVHVSGRPHSVPVSSYRSRLADGQSHRVDVYPLVVSETALPRDRKLQLFSPAGKDDNKLTVLEKINIKAAIIGSRMETQEAAGKPPRRPRSQFASNKLREFKIQDIERKYK